MNKRIPATLVLSLLAACSHNSQQASSGEIFDAKAAKEAKQDERGHPARPMSQQRLTGILEKYNRNQDQRVDWSEYNAHRRDQFDRTDTNKNDTVDTEEYVYEFEGRLDDRFEEARKDQIKQTVVRFGALDKNDDGKIVWDEYATSGLRTFTWWDSNKDGVINAKDPKPTYQKKTKSTAVAKTKTTNNGKPKKKRRSILNMPTTHTRKGMLEIYDANDDGIVSKQEFEAERRSLFHIADKDKSGSLDQSEYLGEYEDRLDTSIANSRRASIKQTYVRFNALDDNNDQAMTFDEFQISGKRIFDRWDKNQDRIISALDISANDTSKQDSYK